MSRLFLTLFFLAAPAHAIVTAHVTFREPVGWRCTLQGTRWICTSPLLHERDGTVLLSVNTEAPPGMTLDRLEKQLREAAEKEARDKKIRGASVQGSKRIKYGDVTWVETIQKNVSAPGVTLRHLATLLPYDGRQISVLVGYQVSEALRPRLLPSLERALATVRPVFTASPRYKPVVSKARAERCAAGDAVACYLELQTRVTPAGVEEQRTVYGKACAVGADEACLSLASVLLNVPQSFALDEPALRASCGRGVAEVCGALGLLLVDKKSDGATPMLRKACEGGVRSACRAAFPSAKNESERRRWLELACQAGDGESCFVMARTAKTPKEALERDRDGCQGGHAGACLSATKALQGKEAASYLEHAVMLLASECDTGRKEPCDMLQQLRTAGAIPPPPSRK